MTDTDCAPPPTEEQMNLLCGMVDCHKANTGRLPATMKELADHWYDMYPSLADAFEQQDEDHTLECIWLRRLQKRPDADALLAKATRANRDPDE